MICGREGDQVHSEALPDSIYRHNSQNSRCCASFSVGIDVWRVHVLVRVRVGGACTRNALLHFGRVGKVEELIFFLRDSGGRLGAGPQSVTARTR